MTKKTNKVLQRKKEQTAFLEAFKKSGVIVRAAEAAGISRQTHYDWMRDDPDYPEKFRLADEEAADYLEREARRRAVEGWEEPVFHKGEIVGHVRKYSDSLLIFMLKGAKPEKYKERTELKGEIGVHKLEDFIS